MSTARLFVLAGSVAAALAVALGAFGAHALRARVAPDVLSTYHTAVQYHFYHALGLVLIGLIAFHLPGASALRLAGWLMLAGIVVFSGSLYLISIGAARWWGMLTPFGGAAFIAAWILVAVAVVRG